LHYVDAARYKFHAGAQLSSLAICIQAEAQRWQVLESRMQMPEPRRRWRFTAVCVNCHTRRGVRRARLSAEEAGLTTARLGTSTIWHLRVIARAVARLRRGIVQLSLGFKGSISARVRPTAMAR